MSAYRDACEALSKIAEQARHAVTADAVEQLDPAAYLFIVEALGAYSVAVHLATQEATANAVEGVDEIEVVARWEARLAAAQARLSDAVGAAVVLGAVGGGEL
ncbi:hypothetical protein [Conexibacter sp. S30A1]|uniref:hypothetical protein n=1 Tax=Conexibacter sp. S30A1 TaxID=2937800 RepID=UPI00200C14E0|nr:hypothetical protein [Conexibacter sp. S30A1]